jgi:hypothetical protein
MPPVRTLVAWLVALTLLLAHPVAGLGSCRRCPPDCPMHLRAAERAAGEGSDGVHVAGHGDGSGTGHAHADAGVHAGGATRCHDPAPRAREDGPCLGGVCGHMDAAAAPALPDGVLLDPKPVAAPSAALGWVSGPVLLHGVVPRTPPTEPPRALLA